MKRNARGFAIYTEFVDTYANEVRVQESSSIVRRCWIFCRPTPDSQFEHYERAPAPHLTPAQARRVARALLRFAGGKQ